MRINASLAVGETNDYSCFLVRELLNKSLAEVAEIPEVRARYAEFARRRDRGMQKFTPTSDLREKDGFQVSDQGIVVFSVDSGDATISRYAPFTVAPDANYSLGVITDGNRTKISAMRNPWRHFDSVPLGEIFKAFGGGGHQRVASTRLHGKSKSQVLETLSNVKAAIESAIEEQLRKTTA
jgi:nanoRNase/pAp phosphatase (c-di-AMP/oligoRNAs hydrolase)